MSEHTNLVNNPVNIRSSALAEGIKAVGVGKQGSVNCSSKQIELILQDYRKGNLEPAQVGAFFGALWTKGVAEEEMALNEFFPENCIDKPQRGISYILKNSTPYIKVLAAKIINNEILSFAEASKIGEYLFADNSDNTGKAFIASALRVRYTDPLEYLALHQQIQNSFAPQFKPVELDIKLVELDKKLQPNKSLNLDKSVGQIRRPIIQMAEPFDGVERSHLLTPIIARHFANKGYEDSVQTGRSSGPKFGLNLLEIAQQLQAHFIKSTKAFSEATTAATTRAATALIAIPQLAVPQTAGQARQEYYVDQKDLSPAMDQWVEIRKIILKRPFLATLEKYVDPFGLNIFMASAFHHTFTDKMVEIAEAIGFPAIIISFRGVEGSLGLSLGRTAQIICSVRQKDGSYLRNTIEANPENYGFEKQVDPKLTKEDVAKNAELIQNYFQHKESGKAYFDKRVSYNIQVYEQALAWVNTQLSAELN
jgi:anthranilate phosphoribosyltransferase